MMQPLQNPPLGSLTNPQRGDLRGREKKTNWDLLNTRETYLENYSMMQTFVYRLPHYCYLYYDVCLIARPPTGPSFAEKEISLLQETGPLPQTVHTRPVGFLKELSETEERLRDQIGNSLSGRGNTER
jgi:hypothetical protein